MLHITVFEAARIIDLLQDAGMLDELPAIPEDSQDFMVGEDSYMIEACSCGETTCLEWKALSITNDFGATDREFDLIITLAVRAKVQGYVRYAQYLVDASTQSKDLAYHLTNTPTTDWVSVCKLYDPLVVGLAMSALDIQTILDEGTPDGTTHILHPTLHHVH